MTEIDEVAESIWRSRSSAGGNGLNATMPIRSMDDAIFIARHHMGDETKTIINHVASALFGMARKAGTVLAKQPGAQP